MFRLVHVPVTLLYTGLIVLLVGGLAVNVSRLRIAKKVLVGEPDKELLRAIRAHGNAVEYAPLQLFTLLLLELSGSAGGWLHVLGGTILLARGLHAFGFYKNKRLAVAGATLSYLVTFALGLSALQAHFK